MPTEFGGRHVEAAGTGHEIVDGLRREQIARRILDVDPEIGWPHHDPASAQIAGHLRRLSASKVGVAGDGAQRAFALLCRTAEQEICDTFFGDDVGDVVAVDHHRRQRQSRGCREINRVQPLHEARRAVRLPGLDHLQHELAAPAAVAGLLARAQPGWTGMAAPSCVRTHVGRAAKTGDPILGCGRTVALCIDLKGRTDEQVARILAGGLRQGAVRSQVTVGPDRKYVGAFGHIAFHPELGPETIDALDKAGLDRGDQRRVRIENEVGGDLALQAARGAEGRQDQFDRGGRIADAVIEPANFVRLVDGRDGHHRHQYLVFPDLGRIAGEQRFDRIMRRALHHDIDPVSGDVDPWQLFDDLIDLRHHDAAAERRGLDDHRRVLGVRAGVEVAVPVGLVRDHERDARRQVHQHAAIEFKIGVDRTDLQRTGCHQLGQLPALRPGKGKIQPVGDAPLEHRQMIGKRQHRLHHVQIVQTCWIGFREGRGEEIGLLLVVALDHDPVAGLDDRLEQFGSALWRTDLGAGAAYRRRPGQPFAAICCPPA